MLHRTQMANGLNAASFRSLAASCVYRNSKLELSPRVQRWHDDLVNPSSAQGDFSNSPSGGAFQDQFTFQLVGGPKFLSIASVTNVFPRATEFITNFTAAVWTVGADGIVNNADDVEVIGPVNATLCAKPHPAL